jgi:UDP-glucose 4-epimerase
MNILVTGGAGFIGSHLCDALLEQGHRVVVIDNLILGRIENIQHLFKNSLFKFCKANILNMPYLNDLFKTENFDEVYHFAANSDIQKGTADPTVDRDLTFQTTFNLLDCLRKQRVKRFIFTSSSAIYGETCLALAEHTGPLIPTSLYGAAKLASEAFITAFAENYDIQNWILRFPNVVGERSTHGVIYDFIKKLQCNPTQLKVLGDGMQKKPYIYVRDLIQGILFVRQNASEKINIFNIGVDSQTLVKDIARMVVQKMKLNSEIIYEGGRRGWIGDVPEYKFDLSKIHNLGWRSLRTSDESVDLAITSILESMQS